MARAQDQVIKELGTYAVQDVSIDEAGATVYIFGELDREKKALAQYRAGVDTGAAELGKVVFDSDT
jgi:hypothetical protein